MDKEKMSPTQKAAFNLLQHDFRYLYTILGVNSISPPNYSIAMIPYLGLIVDGAENWISTMNRFSPGVVGVPTFKSDEKAFYEAARSSIKLWEKSYSEIFEQLHKFYTESDQHFSSLCKPIAKALKLYDIFGAYTLDGHYAGNTILWALTLPGYHLEAESYGPAIKNIATIAGTYTAKFDATKRYPVTVGIKGDTRDFGGFVKSPVGNAFSYRFVLFSLLCQLNFIIYGVEELIDEEPPTKLRFSYILYYYLCDLLSQVNLTHRTSFSIDSQYKSRDFRNAMAHYKVGVYLKQDELIIDDLMYGMTQKAFGLSYSTLKDAIMSELAFLSNQIEEYLKL